MVLGLFASSLKGYYLGFSSYFRLRVDSFLLVMSNSLFLLVMSNSLSSSSSRVPCSRDTGKLPIKEESLESLLNLDHLEIPDTISVSS